jgi:hypothetical protein
MDTINPINHLVKRDLENPSNPNRKYHIRIQKCKKVDNNMEIYTKNNQDNSSKFNNQDNPNNNFDLLQEDRINWMYVIY